MIIVKKNISNRNKTVKGNKTVSITQLFFTQRFIPALPSTHRQHFSDWKNTMWTRALSPPWLNLLSEIVSLLQSYPRHRWRHSAGSQQHLLTGWLCGRRWGRSESPTSEIERPPPPSSHWHLTLKPQTETRRKVIFQQQTFSNDTTSIYQDTYPTGESVRLNKFYAFLRPIQTVFTCPEEHYLH